MIMNGDMTPRRMMRACFAIAVFALLAVVHGLRPGRSGFDVSLGVAVPEPSCR